MIRLCNEEVAPHPTASVVECQTIPKSSQRTFQNCGMTVDHLAETIAALMKVLKEAIHHSMSLAGILQGDSTGKVHSSLIQAADEVSRSIGSAVQLAGELDVKKADIGMNLLLGTVTSTSRRHSTHHHLARLVDFI